MSRAQPATLIVPLTDAPADGVSMLTDGGVVDPRIVIVTLAVVDEPSAAVATTETVCEPTDNDDVFSGYV